MSTISKSKVVSRRILLKTGVWFSLLNSILILIWSLRYLSLIPSASLTARPFYLFTLVISHFVFLGFIPFFFLYMPITLLTRNKRAGLICAIIGITLLLFLLLIDAYVFSLYRFHINKFVIEQLLGPSASQVFEMAFIQYVMVALIIIALIVVQIYLFRLAYWLATTKKVRNLYIICGIILLLALAMQITHAWGKATDDRSITGLSKYFPLCSPLNANDLLSSLGVPVEDNDIVTDFEKKHYQYPKNNLITIPTKKNLVIIALDSWYYRTLDSIMAPNIYKFAAKSSLFEHHYSGSNGTRTGVFSMFFGLPGVYWNDFKQNNVSPVLMNELQKNDYDIRLFPSASLRNPALDKSVFHIVADQCDAAKGMNAWQRDRNLTNRFITFLKSRNTDSKPFFSFLFYDSLHSMIMPEGYKGPYKTTWKYPKYEVLGFGMKVDADEFKNLYKNMVSYVDSMFGELMAEMEKENLLENTIIIVTGDHGQEFNDNGKNFWGHNGNFSDAQVRIPFIYYSPTRKPREYNHWTAHYDIVPTLMEELFRIQNPASDYSIGKSLFDESKRDFLLVDSYIALGIIDATGNITNVYYDGSYEIQDKNLNDLPDADFNDSLYENAINQISSFYAKDSLR